MHTFETVESSSHLSTIFPVITDPRSERKAPRIELHNRLPDNSIRRRIRTSVITGTRQKRGARRVRDVATPLRDVNLQRCTAAVTPAVGIICRDHDLKRVIGRLRLTLGLLLVTIQNIRRGALFGLRRMKCVIAQLFLRGTRMKKLRPKPTTL